MAEAVTPQSVLVLKSDEYSQGSLTAVPVNTAASIGVGVDFDGSVSGIAGRVTPPGQLALTLTPDSPTSLFIERMFSTTAAREIAFPDGRYTVTLGGAVIGSYPLDLDSTLTVSPPRLTDFGDLPLNYTGRPDDLIVRFNPLSQGPSGTSTFAQLTILDSTGKTVAASAEIGTPQSQVPSYIYSSVNLAGYGPINGDYTGELVIARLRSTGQGFVALDAGKIAVTRFPVTRRTPDSISPTVIEITPASRATIPANALITLRFSEPMRQQAGPLALSFAGTVTSTPLYTWIDGGRAVEVRFSSPLPTGRITVWPQTSDSATTDVFRDLAGNGLRPGNVNPAFYLIGEAPPTDTGVAYASDPAPGQPWTAVAYGWGLNLKYEWMRLEGRSFVSVPGGTGPIFRQAAFDNATRPHFVRISNTGGSVNSPSISLIPEGAATDEPRLVNLSVRGLAGGTAGPLITGFVVQGARGGDVLLRAVGPTLANFGVTGVLAEPQLELRHDGAFLTSTSAWGGNAAVAQFAQQTGAFALPPTNRDAALIGSNLLGGYTAQVNPLNGASGIVLAEAYERATANTDPSGARFGNLAVRAFSGTGASQLTVGFVSRGSGKQPLLVRAVGPGLARFGVGNTLVAPRLTVNRIYENGQVFPGYGGVRNWEFQAGASDIVTAASTLTGAFPLKSGDRDAAGVIFLEAGSYTIVAEDETGRTGTVLVELYTL